MQNPRLANGTSKPARNDHYHGQLHYTIKGNHKQPMPNHMSLHNISHRCLKCGDMAHCIGFTCPAKKYQCKACQKFGHFTSQCFQRKQNPQHRFRQPKAHQIQVDESYNHLENYSSDLSSSKDSFCLQVKVRKQTKGTLKFPETTHLIANIAYRLKQHQTRNQYLQGEDRYWC